MRRLAAVLMVVVLTACHLEPLTVPSIPLSGTWSGASSAGELEITLTQTGNIVTGTGSLAADAAGTHQFTIDGTAEGNEHYQAVNLRFTSPTTSGMTVGGVQHLHSLIVTVTGGPFVGYNRVEFAKRN